MHRTGQELFGLALVAALAILSGCGGDKQPRTQPASQPVTQPASKPASQPASEPVAKPVDLRGPGLTSGMVWTHSEQSVWQGAGKLTAPRGPEQNGLAAVQKNLDQRVEVMAVTDSDLPYSVRVEQLRRSTLFEMNGEQTSRNAPYTGKTVEYKYDDSGACAVIVKVEPKKQPAKKKRRGKAAEEAEPEPAAGGDVHEIGCPSITHLLYPKNPVKPGESWSPSLESVRLALGMQQPEELVVQSNRMTLQKVETEGEATARITWDLQCSVTGADKSMADYAVKVSIQRSLVRFLDIEMRWHGKLIDEIPLDRGVLRMDGNYESKSRREPAAHASPVP